MYSLFIIYILLMTFGTSVSLPLLGKEIQIADLFFIFIFARILWDIKKGPVRPVGVIGYLIIILSALLLIACGFSADKAKSFVEFFSISYLMVLYLWVSGMKIDQPQLKIALNVWLYLTAFLGVLGLCGFIVYSFFGRDNPFILFCPDTSFLIPLARINATFPTMNMFSSYLHIGVVFLLALARFGRRAPKHIILGLLIFLCILLTASRNWLGIAITVFLAIIPLRRRLALDLFKYITLGFILFLFIVVSVTTTWTIYPVHGNHDRDTHRFRLSVNTSPSLYAIYNKMSAGLIKKNLLTGVGPGMFNHMLVEGIDWEEAKDTYEVEGRDRFELFDPHNTYLGWAAEAGLPFIIVLIGLFCVIGRLLWRGYRACGDSFSGWFSYVCLCGLIGFMVNASYIDILTMRHFWIMLGLGTMSGLYCLEPRQS